MRNSQAARRQTEYLLAADIKFEESIAATTSKRETSDSASWSQSGISQSTTPEGERQGIFQFDSDIEA
jgi:hypothetical protein